MDDLSNLSMLEIFRVETENQTTVLTNGLLELEKLSRAGLPANYEGGGLPPSADTSRLAPLLESLMRSAHSLKGAARIVNLSAAGQVAHAMEDCFVAAQKGRIQIGRQAIDVLLLGVDLIRQIADGRGPSEKGGMVSGVQEAGNGPKIEEFLKGLAAVMEAATEIPDAQPAIARPQSAIPEAQPATLKLEASPDRVLRLTAENLNRLLGLAGESLVESRWLRPFSDSIQRLKRMQSELEREAEDALEAATPTLDAEEDNRHSALKAILSRVQAQRKYLADRIEELEMFERRTAHLSHRLYLEVLRARMRPFGDGTQRFPRMVRELARALGKQARLEVVGENTQVDRDILERLETPLAHLLRNAVDHGCETPEERCRAGKPPEAVIRLEARHSAGMLQVSVADDGAGLDPQRLRRRLAEKKLTTPVLAEKMQENELLEFLFLPGFTLKETVTEISGRGVGLDVVQNMVKNVRGTVRVFTQPGRGMKFQLQLPLTLSVLRTLLVEVGGEPYAVPLAQIAHTLRLGRDKIEALEGRRHFRVGEQQIGLLSAHEVLDCGKPKPTGNGLPTVVLGDRNNRYGLVVDRFLGERELVVQPLDPRLGKVKDISAAALMEDGAPVLIVDVEDMLCSIERLIASGSVSKAGRADLEETARKRKRVLAVDDSLTVRELERKLLLNRGYLADVAVDGMDGWNAVRTGVYNLVITDVDMPRMDGIELAKLIKQDAHLKSLPVMIVSYKDREEDRLRGLEAGADYYLTKGSFHDERLLEAVVDLIGEPES